MVVARRGGGIARTAQSSTPPNALPGTALEPTPLARKIVVVPATSIFLATG
jgi:hypothetical protein